MGVLQERKRLNLEEITFQDIDAAIEEADFLAKEEEVMHFVLKLSKGYVAREWYRCRPGKGEVVYMVSPSDVGVE